jgi:hypothetical protein
MNDIIPFQIIRDSCSNIRSIFLVCNKNKIVIGIINMWPGIALVGGRTDVGRFGRPDAMYADQMLV